MRQSPLVQGLQRALLTAGANYGVSVDGTLAYISGERVSNRSDTGLGVLVWVDRVGRREAIDAPVGNYRTPRVSPDGTRIVMTYGVGDEEGISVYDLARGTLTRMPDDSDVTYIGDPTPIWSPDGLQIAYFARGETGGVGIFVRRADGIGVAERLSTGLHRAVSWSPDGARLTSTYPGGAGETRDVGVVGMTEGATGQPLLASPTANEGSPFVSPDGEWIAYVTDETGEHEVFVRPFPNVEDGRTRLSTDGGFDPVWAPDGSALYYRRGDTILEVEVRSGAPPSSWGVPTELFSGSYQAAPPWPRHYDIDSDGERFVMIEEREASRPRVIIVQNWLAELERLVPTD